METKTISTGTIRYWAAAKGAAGTAEESYRAGTLAQAIDSTRGATEDPPELARLLRTQAGMLADRHQRCPQVLADLAAYSSLPAQPGRCSSPRAPVPEDPEARRAWVREGAARRAQAGVGAAGTGAADGAGHAGGGRFGAGARSRPRPLERQRRPPRLTVSPITGALGALPGRSPDAGESAHPLGQGERGGRGPSGRTVSTASVP